jgi:hypothetical protein
MPNSEHDHRRELAFAKLIAECFRNLDFRNASSSLRVFQGGIDDLVLLVSAFCERPNFFDAGYRGSKRVKRGFKRCGSGRPSARVIDGHAVLEICQMLPQMLPRTVFGRFFA